MYASASSYHPGADATSNYRFLREFTLTYGGTEATLYGEWNVNFDNRTLAQIDDAKEQPPVRLILAFRGTDNEYDWISNVRNTFGHRAPVFDAAVAIARRVKHEYPGIPIMLAGHSLGGGEAALAAISTGLEAITFNAEGVRPSDYGYSSTVQASNITNYYVIAEPVTSGQAYSVITAIPTGTEIIAAALAIGNQVPIRPVTWPSLENHGNHSMNAVEPAVLNYFSVAIP
jgi:hypothetical protein